MEAFMAEQAGGLRDNLAQKRTDLAVERTAMAVERTAMAADRSLEAWIRTALSMISFGFTIYKFLQSLSADLAASAIRQQTPRHIGLLLIGLGTASLILGTIQYFKTMKNLDEKHRYKPWRFPVIIAAMIGALGLLLFFTIFFRAEVI